LTNHPHGRWGWFNRAVRIICSSAADQVPAHPVNGYKGFMSESAAPNPSVGGAADGVEVPVENIASRAASLLPEESAVGSDDSTAQAEAILLESEERINDPAAGL
jgi:hypothetical protein